MVREITVQTEGTEVHIASKEITIQAKEIVLEEDKEASLRRNED